MRSMRLKFLYILIGSWILAVAQVQAQVGAEAQHRRQFEVVSIKPNKSGPRTIQTSPLSWSGGRFTATNATLVDVLVRVYRPRRIQMRGGLNWIDTDRFDFVAKA